MRAVYLALAVAVVVGVGSLAVRGGEPEYDGCKELIYDSSLEPCGGGHQHISGKRDEISLDRSQHRHRYIEEQIKHLSEQVAKLTATVEQLQKAGAK